MLRKHSTTLSPHNSIEQQRWIQTTQYRKSCCLIQDTVWVEEYG